MASERDGLSLLEKDIKKLEVVRYVAVGVHRSLLKHQGSCMASTQRSALETTTKYKLLRISGTVVSTQWLYH
jgi:hypothetical protein